jgi:hypothetical protein
VGDFPQDLEALDDSLDQLDLKFIIRKIESGETLFPVDNRNFLVLEMTKQNTGATVRVNGSSSIITDCVFASTYPHGSHHSQTYPFASATKCQPLW